MNVRTAHAVRYDFIKSNDATYIQIICPLNIAQHMFIVLFRISMLKLKYIFFYFVVEKMHGLSFKCFVINHSGLYCLRDYIAVYLNSNRALFYNEALKIYFSRTFLRYFIRIYLQPIILYVLTSGLKKRCEKNNVQRKKHRFITIFADFLAGKH